MSTQINCQKLFQSIQFIQIILIQLIQFIISAYFVYIQLNIKTVLFQTIHFTVSRVPISKTILFQTIQFSISTQFKFKDSLIVKTFLFQAIQFSQTVLTQTIQFSISMQFSSIQPIDRALSGATTPGQTGPESKGNEGVLRIPQSSSITGTSPSDCLVSLDSDWRGLTPLQRYSRYILQPQPTGQYQIGILETI